MIIFFYTMDTYRWLHRSYGGKWESLSTPQSKEKYGKFFVFLFILIFMFFGAKLCLNLNGFGCTCPQHSTLDMLFWKPVILLIDIGVSFVLSFSQDLHNCLLDIPHFLWEGMLV